MFPPDDISERTAGAGAEITIKIFYYFTSSGKGNRIVILSSELGQRTSPVYLATRPNAGEPLRLLL